MLTKQLANIQLCFLISIKLGKINLMYDGRKYHEKLVNISVNCIHNSY